MIRNQNIQEQFFALDAHQETFFKTGKSSFLTDEILLRDSITTLLKQAEHAVDILPFEYDHRLNQIRNEFLQNEALFDSVVAQIKIRGYKDFGIEGTMRKHIHWIENSGKVPSDAVLTLRRHEKDYIIRNDQIYVDQLNNLITNLLPNTKSDSTKYHLKSYQASFNSLVALDAQIGIKTNSGLKAILDKRLAAQEAALARVVHLAQEKQSKIYSQLGKLFLIFSISLIIVAFVLSYLLATRITKPLTELTSFITRFIDSHFTIEEKTPEVRTKDEIGKLTSNFTLLKNEVISHLKYFKEKVDERTFELFQANKRLEELNTSNARFVPREFLEHLGKTSILDVHPGDQVAGEMTILFSDIRDFTGISETLSPQENFNFINSYFKEIVPVIQQNGGFIDKFIGDTVMAIFANNADHAVHAALGFHAALNRFNTIRTELGESPVLIGTGIHTGQLVLGTIGHEDRLETTVISDAVNIASRIEGLTKYYKVSILISDETLNKLTSKDAFYTRYADEVRVKGKQKSVKVYEVLHPDYDQLKISALDTYNSCIEKYRNQEYELALVEFRNLALQCPEDPLPLQMIHKCSQHLTEGPAGQWDGIKTMQEK